MRRARKDSPFGYKGTDKLMRRTILVKLISTKTPIKIV